MVLVSRWLYAVWYKLLSHFLVFLATWFLWRRGWMFGPRLCYSFGAGVLKVPAVVTYLEGRFYRLTAAPVVFRKIHIAFH